MGRRNVQKIKVFEDSEFDSMMNVNLIDNKHNTDEPR